MNWRAWFRRKESKSSAVGWNPCKVVHAFGKVGFREVERSDLHIVISNGTRYLTVPKIDRVHEVTLQGIVRDANMTIEQFRALM